MHTAYLSRSVVRLAGRIQYIHIERSGEDKMASGAGSDGRHLTPVRAWRGDAAVLDRNAALDLH